VNKFIERRLAPAQSPIAIATTTLLAIMAAMLLGSLLFLAVGADPFSGYLALLREAFGTLRGLGFSLVRAAPLTLVALGAVVSWRAGFGYLGFRVASFLVRPPRPGLGSSPMRTRRSARCPSPSSCPSSFSSALRREAFGQAWSGRCALVSAEMKC
jgi:hypothetical protein